jgi:hypothetical protein
MLKRSFVLRFLTVAVHVSIALVGLGRHGASQTHRPAVRNPLGDQLGMSVAAVGDVNGDGKCDFVAGALRSAVGAPGYAVVVSGADGAVLHRVNGAANDDFFGIAVGGGGDVNGDGVGDFVVGAVHWLARVQDGVPGYIRVFSGSNGELLLHVAAPSESELFGQSVAVIPDVNADGHCEIAVAAPALDLNVDSRLGELIVLSGATGELLYSVQGESRRDEFATAIAPIQDLNGDQVGDLLVGAPGFAAQKEDGGYVRGICGATGQTIFTVRGSVRQGGLGARVASGADLDGDSIEDFVVAFSRSGKASTHSVQVFSGATRELISGGELSNASTASVALLRSPTPTGANQILLAHPQAASGHLQIKPLDGAGVAFDVDLLFRGGGMNLCGIGDVDSDGVADFAMGCPWATPLDEPFGPSIGELRLVSGRNGTVLSRVLGGIGGP